MSGGIRPVHPALRGLLAGPMVAYDHVLPPDTVHLGVPSLTATVILAVDEPLDVGWLADPQHSTRRWASVSGLHLRPALIRTHGLQRGIQLSLTAAGCRSLFGLPLGQLAVETVDLADLPRGVAAAEHEWLVGVEPWADRLARVETLLMRRLAPSAPPPDVAHAWRLLVAGRGVAETAREVGWSRRHLVTRVRAEVGLTPKQVGRLGRFDRARRLVGAGAGLAEAAHVAGYADQPHLSREWRALAGRAPTASADPFPNLHDVLGDPSRDWGA